MTGATLVVDGGFKRNIRWGWLQRRDVCGHGGSVRETWNPNPTGLL